MRQVLIVLVSLSIGYSLSYFTLPRHGEVVYNCSIAEISPDFPIEVREQCRKLNMQRGLWTPK